MVLERIKRHHVEQRLKRHNGVQRLKRHHGVRAYITPSRQAAFKMP